MIVLISLTSKIHFRIEHLEPDILGLMPEAVFGQMSPKVVMVTTPNVEFNVLFPDLKGFRHYDHKFEWTRAEFQEWLVSKDSLSQVCVGQKNESA